MPKKIGKFVQELAKNRSMSDQFETDPVGAMTEFGLDERQQEQVLTGDIEELRRQIGEDIKPEKGLVFRVKRG